MARKQRQKLSLKGLRFVKGAELAIHRRGWKIERPSPVERISVQLNSGEVTLLSTYESQVYRALKKLGISFEPQARFGGGNQLGGAITDFYLLDYNIAIEVQGEFHFKAGGQALDLVRMANRKAAGISSIIEIFPSDMSNLIEILRKKIGVIAG